MANKPRNKHEITDKVEEYCRRNNLAQNTQDKYVTNVKEFLRWYQNNYNQPASKAEQEHIDKFIADGLSGMEKSTKNNYIASLRVLYRYVFGREDLADTMHRLKTEKEKKWGVIHPTEYKELIRTIKNQEIREEEGDLELAVELGFKTGMRPGAICSLKKGDINFVTGRIVVDSKRGEREVLLVKDLQERLKKRTRDIEDDEEVFPELNSNKFYYYFKKALRKSGLDSTDRLSPHSLRHGFVMMLVSSDMSLSKVKKLTGHSSVQGLEPYTHIELDEDLEKEMKDILGGITDG